MSCKYSIGILPWRDEVNVVHHIALASTSTITEQSSHGERKSGITMVCGPPLDIWGIYMHNLGIYTAFFVN